MIKFLKSAKSFDEYPLTNKEIIFLGKSNVGKSSLINALYGKDTAYVGKTPGKTKLLNFFNVDDQYTFVDSPGYGYAKRSKEEILLFGQMMEEYFQKREELKLSIMIIDIRHKPTNDDLTMKEFLDYYEKPYIIVANKIDKISNNELIKNKKIICNELKIDEEKILPVSAYRKKNISSIEIYIHNLLKIIS